MNDRARFARAWKRTFGNYGDRGGSDPEYAYQAWFNMIEKRYKRHLFRKTIEQHPSFIKEKLKNLKDDQFGHSAFGLKNNTNFDYLSIFDELKKRYL